ncbi:MAG: hypothetical protein LBQ03_01150 [Puniceicoccales bacterium]|jgi:hypothetical protein|nr:hypothetical protein [Puniceicoccales bacterium]
MEDRTSDVKNIANITSPAGTVKGTSLADVKDQDIKGIGLPPIRKELDRTPVEAAKDEYDPIGASDLSQSVRFDANARATKLTSLDGLPE